MRLYSLNDAPKVCRVIALGYFDGGHVGHQALLAEAVRLAHIDGCESAVFSFPNLPTKTGAPLSSLEDRLAFFERMGIDSVILAPFDEVRDVTAEAFAGTVLSERLGAVRAVCGFNYRFGRGALGNGALLQVLLPQSVVLSPTLYEGLPVSASRIRTALSEGDITSVTAMLGKPYSVSGKVTHGKALGRVLGFPTANISASTMLPRYGVYKTAVTVEGVTYKGLTDVGVRPTVEGTGDVRVETFLCGFSGDLYEKTLSIAFLSFVREEKKFASFEELSDQIARDLENL